VDLRDRDGAIERDDRCRVDRDEPIVQLEDEGPVDRVAVLRARVRRRDRGLNVVCRLFVSRDRSVEVVEAHRCQPFVPAPAVLIFEENQFARVIHARAQPRGLERHEGDERVHLRSRDRR
jgi:hypothetical protein